MTSQGDAAPAGIEWPAFVPPADAQSIALQYQFDSSQWWPAHKLRNGQLRQAERLIRHARRHSAFWANRLHLLERLPAGRLTMTDLRSLPLLHRRDIQEAGAGFFCDALPPRHGPVHRIRTSGSTGTPIAVYGTAATKTFQQALSLRGHLWHGLDLTAKTAVIRNPLELNRAPATATWSPVPGGGPSVLIDVNRPFDELLDRLVAEDPAYLLTHPYTLLGLLDRAAETGVRPASLRLVRTIGEALESRIRARAASLWQVPVIDIYGAMEIGFIAHQCPEQSGLHVMAEAALVEVLDDVGRACPPGAVGRVVVTALHNFASPLIRYALGDYAQVGAPCPCGRGLAVLTRILGRHRNLLIRPSGGRRFVSEHLAGFADAPYRQFKITQTALTDIEVKLVVPRPWTGADEAALAAHLDRAYGDQFNYSFRYVETIPRSANGKYEEFTSRVADPQNATS